MGALVADWALLLQSVGTACALGRFRAATKSTAATERCGTGLGRCRAVDGSHRSRGLHQALWRDLLRDAGTLAPGRAKATASCRRRAAESALAAHGHFFSRKHCPAIHYGNPADDQTGGYLPDRRHVVTKPSLRHRQ